MASRSSYQSLLRWRPRYWLPASVSQLARNDASFRRVLMIAADLALVSAVAGLAWEFRQDLSGINAPDWMLLIGLTWLAHMALAVYLPAIFIQSSPLLEFPPHRFDSVPCGLKTVA